MVFFEYFLLRLFLNLLKNKKFLMYFNIKEFFFNLRNINNF